MPISVLDLTSKKQNNSATHREPVFGMAAAPPQTGNWLAGDVLHNTFPAVGKPTGWICTTTGTPGLWITLPEVVS